MFYREAGQFKTTYAADMAIFPIRQDRIGLALILLVAFVVIPADRRRVLAQLDDDPVPRSCRWRRSGSTSSPAIPACCRWARRASWASAPMPATSSRPIFPRVNILVWIVASGFVSSARRRHLRPAEPAHQGLLSRRGDARGAVLPRMGVRARALARQLQRFRRDRGLDPHSVRRAVTGPTATPGDALSRRADDRRRDGLDRLQHRARPHRAHVDGGARHGHRRRTDRHPAAARQAARLRRLVLLHRRRRRA